MRRQLASAMMLTGALLAPQLTAADTEFGGTVGRTLADSVEEWPAEPRAPEGAPNILIWLIDDAGFAQLAPYGGPIATPAVDQVAERGILFNNFHTIALCSPSRAALLAGRNHHSIAMGSHALSPMGFPGYHARIPKSAGSIARILQAAGYATYALGKWDHLPVTDLSAAGPFDRWPSGQGFDHFYGFVAAEANHFDPVLWENHAPVDIDPEDDAYFLTTDLADRAIEYIQALKANKPDKPFFMYWSTGAVHAPHQAPREYIERYAGRFDQGWDHLRETILANQIQKGIVPAGTGLAPKQHEIPDWNDVPDEHRALFARQMEAFAAQLEHTDHEFGRILAVLERIGELGNTLVVVLSDNGASAEGGMLGNFNENIMFSGRSPTLEENMRYFDDWGGPKTVNHYHTGWSAAGNTPFPLFKHQVHRGGNQIPLILSWPRNIVPDEQVRQQYHHVIDLVPTILDAIGVEKPEYLDGILQQPFDGTSMTYAFANPDAPSTRTVQYYEVWGNRGIYKNGWTAATVHAGIMPWHHGAYEPQPFEDDVWQLFHVAEDFSQSRDLARENPEKLRELQLAWESEAEKYNVYPLDADKTGRLVNQMNMWGPKSDGFTYFPPGTSRIPESLSPPVKNRSHRITAEIETDNRRLSGMIATTGGVTSGYAFYVKDGYPVYSYNLHGLALYEVRSRNRVPLGASTVRMEFEKTGEFSGVARLYIDGEEVGEVELPETVRGVFSVQEGFDVGRDSGSAVSDDYAVPFRFEGRLNRVDFDLL